MKRRKKGSKSTEGAGYQMDLGGKKKARIFDQDNKERDTPVGIPAGLKSGRGRRCPSGQPSLKLG